MSLRWVAVVFSLAAAAFVSCGRDEQACLALPCALPAAIRVAVTDGGSGAPLDGAVITVSGALSSTFTCNGMCLVPGTQGSYTIELSAPGFATQRTTLIVRGTTPECGCPTVEMQSLAVALARSGG